MAVEDHVAIELVNSETDSCGDARTDRVLERVMPVANLVPSLGGLRSSRTSVIDFNKLVRIYVLMVWVKRDCVGTVENWD